MKPARRQPCRLAQGGLVDRDQPITFRFDGHEYQGYAGDTLASALLANGVRLVARSYKLHRPRGIYSTGEEEPTGLVETGAAPHRTPNCRAPQVVLAEGLEARGQRQQMPLQLLKVRPVFFSQLLCPPADMHTDDER